MTEWIPPSTAEGWREEAGGLWTLKDPRGKVISSKWSPEKRRAMQEAREKARQHPHDAEKLGQLFVEATRPDATEEQRTAAKDALIKSLASEVVRGGPRAVAAIQALGNTLGSIFREKATPPQAPVILMDPAAAAFISSLDADEEYARNLERFQKDWLSTHIVNARS